MPGPGHAVQAGRINIGILHRSVVQGLNQLTGPGKSIRLGRKGDNYKGIRLTCLDVRRRLMETGVLAVGLQQKILGPHLQKAVHQKAVLLQQVSVVRHRHRSNVRKDKGLLPCRLPGNLIARL